ncbi:DUF4013 domain-containing protein [Syntrophomonas wolfei]|jgi:hypothetical protein|uniref:DUF4013 domain-containing protein n=1 Tax=Syntrophomonas wolfei TaxID=863 RepID=UPI000772EDF2|nr:DUF4013 domain-containing protein [Syntrophomonas wolfei]
MNFYHYIRFPFRDEDWIKKILLGCVISIVPVLNLLSLCYFVECMKFGIAGRQSLPEWERWEDFVREGIIAFLISLGYLLIPLLLAFPLLHIPLVGVFLLSIIILAVGMIFPLAIANFLKDHYLMDAINVKEIFYMMNRVASNYIPAYFIAVFLMALGLTIVFLLPYLSFLGVLLIFYCGMIFFHFTGSLINSRI